MTDPIHSLLGDAIADAPAPPAFPDATAAVPNHRGRWMAAAAAVVLIAGAVTAIAVNRGDDHPQGGATTLVPATTTPSAGTGDTTTAAAGAPTTTMPQDCSTVAVPTRGYDGEGTVMTISMAQQPIDVTVVATPSTVCVGGTVAATITLHNRGAGTERLEYPMLLLRSNGFPKWEVGQLGSVSLTPGETLVLHETVTMPNAAPGEYHLGVFGLAGEATITIDGPSGPSCPPDCAPPSTSKTPVDPGPPDCGVHDLKASEGTTDGAMGTEYTPVTLTNTSGRTCVLGFGPQNIRGVDAAGGVHDLDLSGLELPGLVKPMGTGLLAPGASAEFMLATSTMCYSLPNQKPLAYPRLRLEWIGGVIDMPNTLDVFCGLRFSGLGLPPDEGLGALTAPPTCTDLATQVVEHTKPFHWFEVTLLNTSANRCRLTQPPRSVTQTSGGDVSLSSGWGSMPAPPAPLGDGVADPGETFWLGIDASDCTATGHTQAWTLRWNGGTSRIEVNVTCPTAATTALGFTRSHQDTPGAKECTPDQFTADMVGGDGAMGNRRSYVRLRRIGSAPCIAPKHTTIDIFSGGVRSHVPATDRLDDYMGTLDPAPTVLFPGDRVDYVLVWAAGACDAATATVTEAIVTWAGADLPAQYPVGGQEQICQTGLRVSPLAVPPFSDPAA